MNPQAMEGLLGHFRAQGIDVALLSHPSTLTWLTGYAPPIQTGPSPFEGGPALGWWREGELTLLASNLESAAVAASGVAVREYLGYTIDEPLHNMAHLTAALRDLLGGSPTKGKVAIEEDLLPAAVRDALQQSLPAASFVRCDGAFDRLRAVKSTDEIERLRKAVAVCDRAQNFARRHAQPGMSEIELWGALKADLEVGLGGRIPVLVDLVGGLRTAEIGGLPGGYRLQPGDPLLLDIVPRVDGYWGDNTDTHAIGARGAEMDKIYRVVRQTLRRAVEAVRPGLRARDLDAQMRGDIQRAGYPVYPHHSGHGLGASYHEEPRIVPYNDLPLQAGMVIALEPGVYLAEIGGVRLEDVVLVTDAGCEVLTTHLREDGSAVNQRG